MIKYLVRRVVGHGISRLNAGDPSFLFNLAHPEVELTFPGDNSWSTMFRPTVAGRQRHVTHRGLDECRAFGERFVESGLHLEIEDVLVNGPPWRMRVAVRAVDHRVGPDGTDEYANRVVAWLELRWGRLRTWEDYEDTERVARWDRQRS